MCLDHQRVELRVLCFLHPVMAQQALELRVEVFVVSNAVERMRLCHPLDPQDDERHAQRAVGQNGLSDFLRRPDGFAVRHEACLKLFRELFSYDGGCNSRPVRLARLHAAWRTSPKKWATNLKRPSTAPSSANSAPPRALSKRAKSRESSV